jgi:hypothetical protein
MISSRFFRPNIRYTIQQLKSSFTGTPFMHTRLFTTPTVSPAESAKKLFADFTKRTQERSVESEKLQKEYQAAKEEKRKAEELVKSLMVKEKLIKEKIEKHNESDCDEIKELFAAKFKAMDSEHVPKDLTFEKCTHDLGSDTMSLTVKTTDTKFSIGQTLEATILDAYLVGGTGNEYTKSGIVQSVTLRNYPYNTERGVYQEILEKLTGVKLDEAETLAARPPSPKL